MNTHTPPVVFRPNGWASESGQGAHEHFSVYPVPYCELECVAPRAEHELDVGWCARLVTEALDHRLERGEDVGGKLLVEDELSNRGAESIRQGAPDGTREGLGRNERE